MAAVAIIEPLRDLFTAVDLCENHAAWEATREAALLLPWGRAAHIKLQQGVARRIPGVRSAFAASQLDVAPRREAILKLFEAQSEVASLAKCLLRGRGEEMNRRIFNNKLTTPADHAGNVHVKGMDPSNMFQESVFAGMKYTVDKLQNVSAPTASALASLNLSGALGKGVEVFERQRKAAYGKGGAAKKRRHATRDARADALSIEDALLYQFIPRADVDEVIRVCMSRAGREKYIVAPRKVADLAQTEETLRRKLDDASELDRKQAKRATVYRAIVKLPRAHSRAELDALLRGATTDGRRRAVLAEQIRIRRVLWKVDVPALTVRGTPRDLAELKEAVVAMIEGEESDRAVPPAPQCCAVKECKAWHTEHALALRAARQQLCWDAGRAFHAALPNGVARLRPGATLPVSVEGVVHVVPEPLRAAAASPSSGEQSGAVPADTAYKIVMPHFANDASAGMVCLVYPVAAYPHADEKVMVCKPAEFDRVIVCEHEQVLTWLDLLAHDLAEGSGAEEGESEGGGAEGEDAERGGAEGGDAEGGRAEPAPGVACARQVMGAKRNAPTAARKSQRKRRRTGPRPGTS